MFSMEQLYGHLKESGLPALEPIRVTQSGGCINS